MKPMDMPRVMYEMIALKGGLDLVTPTLSLKPGVARDALNYECNVTGGYTRIAGYERFDGHTSPSTAVYTILGVTMVTSVTLGDTITGQTSGTTGVLLATPTGQLVLTAVTGPFTNGENLRVGVSVVAVCNSTIGQSGTASLAAAYSALAANSYRAAISRPTGSGPVRGIVQYNGTVYAFRNNVGGTAVDIWKSSAAGWVAVAFYKTVSFTAGGTATPADGATLTQGAVTATVKRVCKQSGAWTGSAVGAFVITTPSGGSGNFAAGAATLSGGATVTLSGIETDISLAPDGHFEFVSGNFGGAAGQTRIFGCDGINKAFEFDGDILAPITTGMPTDAPKHIAVFKNHLFLAFVASLQNSAIGDPFGWTAILGAAEISASERITNLILLPGSQSGGALLVQTRNNTLILYGSSTADFNLVTYNNGVGALDYTAANMAGIYSLDDRGIMGLNATLAYGNFDQASLSANIRPFIVSNRQFGQACCANRERSQYRLFFSNGYGLYATIINDKFIGSLPIYFPDPVFCVWEGEDSSGNEVTYFGSNDGYVHQLDVGTSFDGVAINSYITLNYDAIRGPRMLKRFRKASAEISGSTYAPISVSYSLGYGSADIAPQATASYASDFTVSSWDSGLLWDSGLVWDGRTLSPSEIELMGTAENIAMTFSSNNDYTGQFTINSLLIHYTPRRGIR
jgi:hypothetical protein